MDNLSNALSRSFDAFKIRPGSFSPDRHYIESAQYLVEICHYVLCDTKYAISMERRLEKFDPIKNTATGRLNLIRLKINCCDSSKELTDDDREEIDLKLMDDLAIQLGESNYGALIVAHGKAKGSYFIDLNLKTLNGLRQELRRLAKAMNGQTEQQKIEREKAFEHRKVRHEIKKAEDAVIQVETELSRSNTKEKFSALKRRFEANKKNVVNVRSSIELRAIFGQMLLPPDIEEILSDMFLIFMHFKEAVESDSEFHQMLFLKFPDKTIEKVMEDPGIRLECFIYYIEKNPDYQNRLRQIFNSADPEVNRAKFEGYQKCSESIEKHFNSMDNMLLSAKIADALTHCYAFIDAKEKEYTVPIGWLIDASHFILGSAHLNYEPQFETFDQRTKTVSGPLKSVRLEIIPSKKGAIRSETDFDSYVDTLKNLFGEARFKRLVLSTEILRSMTMGSMKANEEMYYLYLNPAELQTVTLDDLMQDLSPADLKMYRMMHGEKATVGHGQIDQVAPIFRDFVAMYEIYAKFKIATSTWGTKVALTSDSDFRPDKKHDDEHSQLLNFIQFIKQNDPYLTTILRIFSASNMENNEAKCEKYIKACERVYKYTVHDEPKKNWFFALGELVKWCAMVAKIQHLLNLDFPKFLQLQEFAKKMDIPFDINNSFFQKLFALNLSHLNEAKKKANK